MANNPIPSPSAGVQDTIKISAVADKVNVEVPGLSENVLSPPSHAQDYAPYIPQFYTNYDNKIAGKYLIVGDGWSSFKNALLINADASLTSIPLPALLSTSGVNASAGAPIDATKAFFCGGNGGGALAYTFTWADNTWSRVADMPISLFDHGCISVNGNIYVIGGVNDPNTFQVLNSVYKYDPVSDTWSTLASTTGTHNLRSAITEVDGKIFVCGGDNQNGEIYDIAGDTWTPSASGIAQGTYFTTDVWCHYTSVLLHSGKVFVADNGGNLMLFDPATTQWDTTTHKTFSTPDPTGGGTIWAVEYALDKILIVVGVNGVNSVNYYEYDVSANTITALSGFATPLEHGGWLNNNLFGMTANSIRKFSTFATSTILGPQDRIELGQTGTTILGRGDNSVAELTVDSPVSKTGHLLDINNNGVTKAYVDFDGSIKTEAGIVFPDNTTQTTAATSGVGGSGLANKLAFWSSGSVLSYNNNLHFNGSGLTIGDPGSTNAGIILALGNGTGDVKLALKGGMNGASTKYGFGYNSGLLISYIYGQTDKFQWKHGGFGSSPGYPMTLIGEGRLLVNTTSDDGESVIQANGTITAKAGGFKAIPVGPPTGVTSTYQTGLPNPLPNSTYYYRISAVTPFGESLASNEISEIISAGGGGNPVVSWSPVSTAISYNVYGRTSGSEQLLANVTTTSFTDNSTIIPSGDLPTVDRSSGIEFPDGTYQSTAATSGGGGFGIQVIKKESFVPQVNKTGGSWQTLVTGTYNQATAGGTLAVWLSTLYTTSAGFGNPAALRIVLDGVASGDIDGSGIPSGEVLLLGSNYSGYYASASGLLLIPGAATAGAKTFLIQFNTASSGTFTWNATSSIRAAVGVN